MLASRKLVIAGLVLVGVLLLVALASNLRKSDPYQSTCDKFIGYVMKQDYTSSYDMLSTSAKSLDSQDSWKGKVLSLTNAYKQGKLNFESKNELTQSDGSNTQNRTELSYTVTNPAATSDLTCYITTIDKQYFVDGFQSIIR